jgi:hypothetical protein
MKQRFASFSGIVHKLEETEVQGEFLLGNALMGAQPAPQERPKPFHGIHMDFTQAVAIFISGVLASSMVDTLMIVAPSTQTCINTVFICINKRTQSNGLFHEWLDSLLLHIGKHIDDHLTTALNHAKDGRSLFVQGATATLAFESVSTSFSSLILDDVRLPFMACNDIRFVTLHLV